MFALRKSMRMADSQDVCNIARFHWYIYWVKV